MNTVFTIITAAIVAGVIIMLISMAIVDHIFYAKEEKRRSEEREMEKYYNSCLPKRISLNDVEGARGFISCEYAFGRWYLRYFYRDPNGVSYSITKSFDKHCKQLEGYGRKFSKYKFENETHDRTFSCIENVLKETIMTSVASYK